jgi:hypothetical protein
VDHIHRLQEKCGLLIHKHFESSPIRHLENLEVVAMRVSEARSSEDRERKVVHQFDVQRFWSVVPWKSIKIGDQRKHGPSI